MCPLNTSQTAATRPHEQDPNTLVNTLLGAQSMDSSSLQHSIIAGISESVQCPASNAYHTEGLAAHVATRSYEEDLTTLVNTLLGAHFMDSSSLQHSIIVPFQVDAGISESVQCPASNAYHTEGLAAHTDPIVCCKKQSLRKINQFQTRIRKSSYCIRSCKGKILQ